MKVMIGLLLLAPLAIAADYDCGHSCDLAKLVSICKALEGDAQIKPFTTEIKCGGSQTYWETSALGTFPLPTKQNVTTKVSMKGGKYTLPDAAFVLPGIPTLGDCVTFKELVGFHAPVSKILNSCADLEAVYKMGQAAYCKKVLGDSGSQLVEVKPTGKSYSNCPSSPAPTPVQKTTDLGGVLEREKQEKDGGHWYELSVISLTSQDGLLARLGMKVGDRLSSVNGVQVSDVTTFGSIINELSLNGGEFRVMFFQTENQYYVERSAKL